MRFFNVNVEMKVNSMTKKLLFICACFLSAMLVSAQDAPMPAPDSPDQAQQEAKPKPPRKGDKQKGASHGKKSIQTIVCPKCGAQIELKAPPPPPHKRSPKDDADLKKEKDGPRPPAPEADKGPKGKPVAPDAPKPPKDKARKPRGNPPPPPEILVEQSEKFMSDLDGAESSDEMVSVRMEILLKRFDKDGDGKLSEDERAAAKKEISKRKADFEKRENKFVKNMMAKFDKDDDGKLSEPEFKEFIVYQRTVSAEARKDMPQRFGKDAGPKIPVEFFKALGVEAKSLNFKERHLVFGNFKKIYAKGLKQFDADSNGKLDKEELKSMMDSESFKADMAKLQSQLQKGKGGK